MSVLLNLCVPGGYGTIYPGDLTRYFMPISDKDGIIENFRQIAASLAPKMDEMSIGDLIISSEYNVYLSGDKLTYINRHCNQYDTAATFFLHMIPVNNNHSPEEDNKTSFEKLDFTFDERGHRDGRLCVTTYSLPEYEIKRIRTGQYVTLKFLNMRVWESGWREIRPSNQ